VDSLIEAIEAFDGAVVIVTHSEMILQAVAERLVVFDDDTVSVFDGTYQDFLDRVGWREEVAGEKEPARYQKTGKGIRKKDLRKMRAEIIENRSRVLNPLQKRIEEIEKTIVQFEKKADDGNQALIDASKRGEVDAIGRLSRELADLHQRIEKLFEELATLSENLENKTREFEDQLNEVA
jgi:ATP-binding cassette subfamily F protein 3